MKRTGVTTQYWIATLALASLLSAAPAGAQSQGTMPQDRDSDLTWRQLSAFDQFLDNHPEVSDQLRKDPSLINNQEFVENHSALKQYLQDHPEVREEINQNPNAVMRQEQRFDRNEDRDRDRDRDRDHDRDVTRTQLADVDHFMDSHPEIAEQMRKNPALMDDRRFVESHPALQQFLATHPEIREEVRHNPGAFMSAEGRFDRREDAHLDTMMDQFLDNHPEIAEQLRKNPALVNDKEFVEHHAALQQFLATHPELQRDYKSDPNAFMRQEERFDQRQDAGFGHDRDMSHGQISSFHEFLEGHGNISTELSKNPLLATNQEYLENHPALQTYLKSNPQVNEELKENPQSFVKSAQSFESTPAGTMPKSTAPVKGTVKPSQPQK